MHTPDPQLATARDPRARVPVLQHLKLTIRSSQVDIETMLDPANQFYVIGRGHRCDIKITDEMDSNASRVHAILIWRNERWEIRDLSSYAGLQIDNMVVTRPMAIRRGQVIHFTGNLRAHIN